MEGHKMSDRELLIRIDERQQQMNKDIEGISLELKNIKLELGSKISKSSITWLLTIAGGTVGFVSTVLAIADKAH